MSVMAFRAVKKEVERLNKLKATSSAEGIKKQIAELQKRAKDEPNDYIRELMESQVRKLEKQEAKSELPAYVDPVHKHLSAALEEMEKHKDYTEGLRRGD